MIRNLKLIVLLISLSIFSIACNAQNNVLKVPTIPFDITTIIKDVKDGERFIISFNIHNSSTKTLYLFKQNMTLSTFKIELWHQGNLQPFNFYPSLRHYPAQVDIIKPDGVLLKEIDIAPYIRSTSPPYQADLFKILKKHNLLLKWKNKLVIMTERKAGTRKETTFNVSGEILLSYPDILTK